LTQIAEERTTQEDRYAAYLVDLAGKDRGALAALRRGLGREPGEVAEVHPYVVPWLPKGARRDVEDAYYLVASLFASHPMHWHRTEEGGRHTFGASLERLARQSGSAGVEPRLIAILNSPREDLPNRLRQAVGLLKTHEIPVDWARLLKDLRHWDSDQRWVQRNWAADFWGARAPEPTDENDGGTE